MQANLVAFLRNIPQSNQDAQTIEALVGTQDAPFMRGCAVMLQAFGAVILEGDSIRASSQTAKYWLNSLADMLAHGVPIVTDWKQRGLYPTHPQNPLQNGATFLRWLEEQRLHWLPSPTPSRQTGVAQVLIKRTNPETGEAELLFQYDHNAQQYQLIGGREAEGETNLQTIVREIEEELTTVLRYGDDYALACVVASYIPPLSISNTFGALTQYHFTFYHMTGLKRTLALGEGDRWIPVLEALTGTTALDPTLYRALDALLPNGISGLDDSF
jgi:8-oxo-dGTP pyrophosphatase MutT (NUDIX family)